MVTNINIISGFLGAGKTTLLKKIIPNMNGEIALIENEFGDVSIDGDLMGRDIPMKEIYAGCICCSLVGNFKDSIKELALEYKPNYIFIEPSGVGSLSDIIKVCNQVAEELDQDIKINQLITVVDASVFEEYIDNFGGFYLDQIQNAHIIFLSHLDEIDEEERIRVISEIRKKNENVIILENDWYNKDGKEVVAMLNEIKNCEINVKGPNLLTPANKTFSSLAITNVKVFSEDEIHETLKSLKNEKLGYILRAKGIVKGSNNQYISFNFTPHHYSVEPIEGVKETKIAIIGSKLNEGEIIKLFKDN